MNNFEVLGLPETMLPALEAINFTIPTPIQAQAIPVAMEGHDILGSAQTGTGKTGAFTLPMIAHLLSCPASSALILLPTRELARQVLDAADKMLGNRQKILSALLIGGDSMIKQLQQLKKKPRIIVGTPGRINDHLRQGTLKLNETDFLVLDETDRMLDMGFGAQLEQIAKYLPAARQTLMFSATLPANIISLSRKYLNNPVRIAVGATTAPAANIRQELIKTTDAAKYGELINQLQNREGSVLVFVKTKYGAERLAQKLAKENQLPTPFTAICAKAAVKRLLPVSGSENSGFWWQQTLPRADWTFRISKALSTTICRNAPKITFTASAARRAPEPRERPLIC